MSCCRLSGYEVTSSCHEVDDKQSQRCWLGCGSAQADCLGQKSHRGLCELDPEAWFSAVQVVVCLTNFCVWQFGKSETFSTPGV